MSSKVPPKLPPVLLGHPPAPTAAQKPGTTTKAGQAGVRRPVRARGARRPATQGEDHGFAEADAAPALEGHDTHATFDAFDHGGSLEHEHARPAQAFDGHAAPRPAVDLTPPMQARPGALGGPRPQKGALRPQGLPAQAALPGGTGQGGGIAQRAQRLRGAASSPRAAAQRLWQQYQTAPAERQRAVDGVWDKLRS